MESPDDVKSSDDIRTFKDLGIVPELCEACIRRGWSEPTPIQKKAIPLALAGRDVIGLAKTGSGKTAAYALPMLQALMETKRTFFGVVITPTRELAFQVKDHIEALGARLAIRVAVLTGGMDFKAEQDKLKQKPHIIVASPGRLLDHLRRTKGFALDNLRYFVFDEADRVLGVDLEKHMNVILSVIPKQRRTMLFSATMNKSAQKLKRASLNDPVSVKVSEANQTVATLNQFMKLVPYQDKMASLAWFLDKIGAHDTAGTSASGDKTVTPCDKSVIIFCLTRKIVLTVHLTLKGVGFRCVPLYGKMDQNKRMAALHKFKRLERNILIATDVASRGLDIKSVDWVVNFDIPASTKDYIHRVGRTARAGKEGSSLTLCNQYDVLEFIQLQKNLGIYMQEYHIDGEEVEILKPAVQAAEDQASREVEQMEEQRKFQESLPKKKKTRPSSAKEDNRNRKKRKRT